MLRTRLAARQRTLKGSSCLCCGRETSSSSPLTMIARMEQSECTGRGSYARLARSSGRSFSSARRKLRGLVRSRRPRRRTSGLLGSRRHSRGRGLSWLLASPLGKGDLLSNSEFAVAGRLRCHLEVGDLFPSALDRCRLRRRAASARGACAHGLLRASRRSPLGPPSSMCLLVGGSRF